MQLRELLQSAGDIKYEKQKDLIHVPRIPPPLNYLARINESEGGGMNRFMSVYNTFARV